jgi:antitoxin FitA
MNKMIQVRNLNPELHKKVKIRATEEGLTITDWVENLIEREVARPSMKDVYARLRTRKPMNLNPSAAEMIREDRDNR